MLSRELQWCLDNQTKPFPTPYSYTGPALLPEFYSDCSEFIPVQ